MTRQWWGDGSVGKVPATQPDQSSIPNTHIEAKHSNVCLYPQHIINFYFIKQIYYLMLVYQGSYC